MSEAFLFDWHQNEAHDALRLLHDYEPGHQQEIADIATDLRHSDLFWHLVSRYQDALQEARQAKNDKRVTAIELAMFARLFAAGTLRRTRVFRDQVALGEAAK